MPVYSYNMKGVAIADYPYIQDDCYYGGYVEDAQDSEVLLSTCNGLWGHLQIGSLRYEIEPIENSSTFQHLIYQRTVEQHEPCKGILKEGAGLTSEDTELIMLDDTLIPDRAIDDTHYSAPIRHLEYYLVADKSKFIAENRNESQLVLVMLLMMADVHNMYFAMGLHIYVVGLELWTEKDYITIGTTNLGITLDAFYHYATFELRHRVHLDHSGIITTKGSPAGLAWGDRFCLYNQASVSAIRACGNLMLDAETIAHQLGHSLGFSHDDTLVNKARHCDCNCTIPGKCIMTSNNVTCRRLSNCSRQVYYDTIRKPGKECFLNVPPKRFRPKMCGNGVLNDHEECDCGRDEEIGGGIMNEFLKPLPKKDKQKSTDKGESTSSNSLKGPKSPAFKGPSECRKNGCCQKNCKFKPGIDCLYGLCCENCKFIGKGTRCREAVSACDLPEYCNGTDADCPPDVYKQDGMSCGGSDSCYKGQCLNFHHHCTALFGKDAKPGPPSCFKEVNLRGDRSGNCGKEGPKYKKCLEKDVFCGRVQCTNIKQIPKFSTGQAVVQTPVEQTWCWGTEFHLGKDVDVGAVKDGTACGSDKICINRSCVDRAVLKFDCDFSKCNNRGVCNSKKNCHCSYGWAPPFCEGRGYGGSVDSGPPPPYTMAVGLIIAIVILVGLALVALGFVAAFKRQKLKIWFASMNKKNIPAEQEDTESIKSQLSKDAASSEA
ncbi:disintegrin and metalloproteinase domain-containing protein 9-like [Hemicordylus capensis]|uniref:disintegrin and metalloproteinase domain-containing protein 9-like n=1 Tax=Hemicordylus capensis TaxID=884348 RepID=UPI0023022BC5|nr:disintegrin and metalloproteinase domain-containing protein 9-like [Hemicordylus capensis]